MKRRSILSWLFGAPLAAAQVSQLGGEPTGVPKVVAYPPGSFWGSQAEIGEGLILEAVPGGWKLKASAASERRDDWIAAAGQAAYVLSLAPAGDPDIYRNGLLQRAGADYSYDAGTRTVTFGVAPEAGAYITARYRG